MLTPEELAAINDYIRSLYEEFEDTVLRDIARRFKATGEITDTAAWQAMRLSELGAASDEIMRLVAEFSETTPALVEELFRDAATQSAALDKTVVARLGKAPLTVENDAYLQQLYKATLTQTQRELRNITQSMGFLDASGAFTPLAKGYQRVLDAAELAIASGATDYTTAIRTSVQGLARAGIAVVDYKSGWRNRADVAARRAILTGIGQVSGEIAQTNAGALGTDYYEVTAHQGARPEHAAWQGKVYKLNGSAPGYPNLAEATGYGSGPGLKGWNCRHDMYPFIPGVSERAYTDEELAEIDPPPFTFEGRTYTAYEATQQQRQLETRIRACKRQLVTAEADGDEDVFVEQSIRLRRLRETYADFSHKAHLPTQHDRAQVLGYGRSVSGKAVWADKQNRASTRKMASGLRKQANRELTLKEQSQLLGEIVDIKADPAVFSFNTGAQTGYADQTGRIHVRADVFPDLTGTSARDTMSSRAVLAHEYYGHYQFAPSRFKQGDWRDEMRASYAAARNAPNLTREERVSLIVDAYDRARDAGYNYSYSKWAKELLYGY